MNKMWLRGALSAALMSALQLGATNVTWAAAPQQPAGRQQGPPPGRGPEQRLDELVTSLNLSAQQKSEVEAIFLNQRQQMEALRNAGDREQARNGMRRVESETDAKLKAVLSAEQYNKYLAQKPQRGPGSKPSEGSKRGKAPKSGTAADQS